MHSFLRDKNFIAVGAVLSKTANMIRSELEERNGVGSVEQMKQIVAKLPKIIAPKKYLGIRKLFSFKVNKTKNQNRTSV